MNLTAPNGTTAFEFLSQAAKQNPCYQFQYKKFSFGRNITSICCVSENRTSHYYWYIYMNDEPSLVGVDQLKPRHGDLLKFQYQHINYNSSNHEKKVGKVSKTGMKNIHICPVALTTSWVTNIDIWKNEYHTFKLTDLKSDRLKKCWWCKARCRNTPIRPSNYQCWLRHCLQRPSVATIKSIAVGSIIFL